MRPDQHEIEDLIARTAIGDRAAFRGLYARTSAKLFGIALRVLDDRAEAEDVLQDVFVKLWNNAGRYRANGLSPMTWLIAVARNTAIDRKRRLAAGAARGGPGGDGAAPLAETLADPAPGPESQVARASDRRQLAACFGELDGRHAEAVRRAYLEGETYADLAARFDVPLNTMRTWLRRSLLRLRECLSR